MYFVSHSLMICRYTGNRKRTWTGLPDGAKKFDYDDQSKWSMKQLKAEKQRLLEKDDADDRAFEAVRVEIERRENHAEVPETDDWEELLEYMDDADLFELESGYDGEIIQLVRPDELSPRTGKIIRDLAKVARGRMEIEKKIRAEGTDSFLQERNEKLNIEEGALRMELMHSDLAQIIPFRSDSVNGFKCMAAMLLFLYAQDRYEAELQGREVNDDYFYAGHSLYGRGAFLQEAMHIDDLPF